MANVRRIAIQAYRLIDRLGPWAALVGVWSLFGALEWQTFATWENTQSILLQTSVVGIAALGGTMVIISGGIDLSVGSAIALTSVVVALVVKSLAANAESTTGIPADAAAVIAAGIGILVAGLCGLAIGGMVVGRLTRVAAFVAAGLGATSLWHYGLDAFRGWAGLGLGLSAAIAAWLADRRISPPIVLSPFIVTLGMWGALRGVAKGIADNSAIYPPTTRLTGFMQLPTAPADFALLLRPWQWWSPGVWVFLGLATVIAAMLRYTQFGRHLYAIGSNEQTARLCGIEVERTKVKIYSLAGVLAGIAGVLQFSFNTMGDPTTAAGYELDVIAAVVIGGASLSGGVGGVVGTVVGALVMKIIDNGCTKVGLEVWMQDILTGGIIVVAVALDQLRRRTTR